MMLNNIIDNSNYINFLFYGPDLMTDFPQDYKITIYKNKYSRLLSSESLPDICCQTPGICLFILSAFISTFKEKNIPVNIDKLEYIKDLLRNKGYSRFAFNGIISIPIVEVEMEDDSEWEQFKEVVIDSLSFISDSFYDDSYDKYRILSYDFNTIKFKDNSFIPDVCDYNIDVINQYLNMIDNNIDIYNSKDDNWFCEKLTSELRYFINMNLTVNGGFFEDTIKGLFDDNTIGDIDKLKDLYNNIIPYVSKYNLKLIMKLQYRLFKSMMNKNYINISNDIDMGKFFSLFVSLDIFIYNKALQYNDKPLFISLYSRYNNYVIKLQDILDELDDNLMRKKYFVNMYKNQIYKTRNKLKMIL